MKKLITMAFIALLMLYAATAQAQIKFGVKGGLNVTRMSFDRAVFDESNQAGFYFGPTMKAGLLASRLQGHCSMTNVVQT